MNRSGFRTGTQVSHGLRTPLPALMSFKLNSLIEDTRWPPKIKSSPHLRISPTDELWAVKDDEDIAELAGMVSSTKVWSYWYFLFLYILLSD